MQDERLMNNKKPPGLNRAGGEQYCVVLRVQLFKFKFSGYFCQLFIADTLRQIPRRLAQEKDSRGFFHDIDAIEGFRDIGGGRGTAVFLPQYNMMLL